MIVQLYSDTYAAGYLPKYAGSSVAPYFGCLNLSIRRSCLDEIGPFDERLRTGEDIDLCLRGIHSRWELYFNPRARVEHWNRTTAAGLARQWFHYGYYHARLFRKHTAGSVEVLLLNPNPRAHARYFVVFYRERAPVRALVFLTSFAALQASAIVTAILALTGPRWLALAALAALVLAALVYLADDVRGAVPLPRRVAFAGLRYLVNASLFWGGLLGGLGEGYLYVYGTLWKKRPRPVRVP